jgi:selenium-binding protein 1
VADIGDASLIPLPVDISISADDSLLWVDTWNDGMARLFDISDPFNPVQVQQTKIGEQVNMTSQSWDGDRIYFTSSLLANWDKIEAAESGDLQYFKAYSWDGEKLSEQFSIDFIDAKLGLPHQMRFGAYSLFGKSNPRLPTNDVAQN